MVEIQITYFQNTRKLCKSYIHELSDVIPDVRLRVLRTRFGCQYFIIQRNALKGVRPRWRQKRCGLFSMIFYKLHRVFCVKGHSLFDPNIRSHPGYLCAQHCSHSTIHMQKAPCKCSAEKVFNFTNKVLLYEDVVQIGLCVKLHILQEHRTCRDFSNQTELNPCTTIWMRALSKNCITLLVRMHFWLLYWTKAVTVMSTDHIYRLWVTKCHGAYSLLVTAFCTTGWKKLPNKYWVCYV